MKPILSIGMIFKNDIRTLERCMKSLMSLRKEIPCELVMADTGSTDGSRQIAEQYADILFDFAWVNDFSAARNAVLERCSGKWHLFVDCDEWLDENCTDLATFFRAKIPEQVNVLYVRINNLLQEDDFEEYSEFDGLRLAKRSNGLHFEGAVHEHYALDVPWCPANLNQVIFWHDGYIPKFWGDPLAKQKRNLPLIRHELEKHPNDPLLLDEALDVAYTTQISMQYAKQGMEVLHSKIKILPEVAGTLWRKCVKAALESNAPECIPWAQEGLKLFKKSAYIQIDVNFYAAIYKFNHYNWDDCCKYLQAYFHALEAYTNGEFGDCDFSAGSVNGLQKSFKERATILMARAYLHKKEWESSARYLKSCPPEFLAVTNMQQWLNTAHGLWEHVDLRQEFHNLSSHFSWATPPKDKLMEKRQEQFKNWAIQLFSYKQPEELELQEGLPETPAFRLLLELGECDLYNGAMVMLAEEPLGINAFAGKIRDWKQFSPGLPLHILRHGANLPKKFYEQPSGRLEQLAANLIVLEDKECRLERIPAMPRETGKKQVWAYYLLLAGVRSADWEKENPRVLLSLWKKFATRSEQFLSGLYRAECLCKDGISLLPDMHAFGWYCAQAWKAENQAEYLVWLRCGLEIAPSTKKMITFLMNNRENPCSRRPSREMQDMADRIQDILSDCSEDDPQVAALQLSPEYKNIEEILSPILYQKDIAHLAAMFLKENYNPLWLDTMLRKAENMNGPDATLIVGSSRTINGIWEKAWHNAVNCSMHAQDIYYISKSAHRVVTRPGVFRRCFIDLSYYSPYFDISLSKNKRPDWIGQIFAPVFGDTHHWDMPGHADACLNTDAIWEYSEAMQKKIQEKASDMILNLGSYYNKYNPFSAFYYVNGKIVSAKFLNELNPEVRASVIAQRVKAHNRQLAYQKSVDENQQILNELIHFLHKNHVLPIIIIPPVIQEYYDGIRPEMKQALLQMVDAVPEDVDYVDFNDTTGIFTTEDFADPNHLNPKGAEKMSTILAEMFGA